MRLREAKAQHNPASLAARCCFSSAVVVSLTPKDRHPERLPRGVGAKDLVTSRSPDSSRGVARSEPRSQEPSRESGWSTDASLVRRHRTESATSHLFRSPLDKFSMPTRTNAMLPAWIHSRRPQSRNTRRNQRWSPRRSVAPSSRFKRAATRPKKPGLYCRHAKRPRTPIDLRR